MAEEKEAAESTSGGGKKKLIMLIVLAVVLISLSVGGTITALKMLSPPPPPVEAVSTEPVAPVKKTAIYYPIKPEIIVNYGDKGRQRYAQVEVTLLIRDDDVVPAVETHSPMITNALVMAIGGQVYEEVQTAEGKELLRQQCLQAIQKILEKEIGKPGVEQVLFTSFIMQ